ncbi:MAG: hypothetical protein DWQ31_09940 [Planctomycetota bacterium]|nr:MAG: hypothetical protein DWQ31_09940 [Planctomycetota bacterium]REJ96844.1 MAG: hypothetical protein DWQ35_03530 [Planctomycetota bacterium]REK24033.1 MAG: hypothetical protein DWQ42_13845 [Planctomycetota bacterium]REK39364.1 MAG: hypothetical protein DWQ46_19000 [Planctomycetota bacterium]
MTVSDQRAVMRRFAMLAALCALMFGGLVFGGAGAAVSIEAPLFYNPLDGNVTIDVTNAPGGIMTGYVIAPGFGGFLPAEHTPIMDTLPLFVTSEDFEVSETNIVGIAAGVYSLGNIMPLGLSESEAAAYFSGNDAFNLWVGQLGTPGNSFSMIYGPSPLPPINVGNPPTLPASWATEATLTYDTLVGSLELDTTGPNGGAIVGFVLDSATGAFQSSGYTQADPASFASATATEIFEANQGGIAEGTYDLGPVMATGMTLADVEQVLSSSRFIGQPGHTPGSFDFEQVGIAMSVRVLAPGDASGDGVVDIENDVLAAFSNFTGPGSFGKTRAEGDVEAHPQGDGDVDVEDLLLMFGNFSSSSDTGGLGGLAPPAAAGDPGIPDLIYDPTTGEVVLDPDGSSIIGYSLQNATNSFLPGNHTPILVGVATALTSQLEEAALAPGSGSIGAVFPTGLDLAGLQALLTGNQVSRSLGAPLVPFDLVVLGPAIPEPTSIALGLLGVLMLVGHRWRVRRSGR